MMHEKNSFIFRKHNGKAKLGKILREFQDDSL